MIDISIRVKFEDIKRFSRRFKKVHRLVARDAYRLGEGAYKYIKTLIPVSKLNKPHLRDSFNVRVNYLMEGIVVGLYPDGIKYAPFVDSGATIPTRYPRNRQAMRFEARNGEIVFTQSAKGFRLKGIGYIAKGERWMGRNAANYIDFSLKRYLT